MQGHVPSVLAVLRVIDQQVRLLGLADLARKAKPKGAWPSCRGPATVVVHSDDCRFHGCERHGRFAEPAPSPSQS